MIELTMERYGQALVDQTAQFAETARRAATDAPVPTCPEWTLSQLVEHVGQTQHWVASIVEKRVPDPSQLPTSFAALPAVRAGQVGPWRADQPAAYPAYAQTMNELAATIAGWTKVT